ncbi:MAG: hypothetical protein WC342_06000 [Methanoregula sp.]|jgi:DNA polymerase I
MQIELRRGLSLQPGSFCAVIAPEKILISAINDNADLQRFLFLFVSGNYSRILPGILRTSKNFEVRRAFTAAQLLTVLREAAHTVVLVEHDPTLFDEAKALLDPVSAALKDAARESLVILYTPSANRSFSILARRADHYVELADFGDPPQASAPRVYASSARRNQGRGILGKGQRVLDVS